MLVVTIFMSKMNVPNKGMLENMIELLKKSMKVMANREKA
jgi:hypothetical protein